MIENKFPCKIMKCIGVYIEKQCRNFNFSKNIIAQGLHHTINASYRQNLQLLHFASACFLFPGTNTPFLIQRQIECQFKQQIDERKTH